MKRIVVVGATSAIAQAYARYIALRQDCSFVLVGRNEAQLIKVAHPQQNSGRHLILQPQLQLLA